MRINKPRDNRRKHFVSTPVEIAETIVIADSDFAEILYNLFKTKSRKKKTKRSGTDVYVLE